MTAKYFRLLVRTTRTRGEVREPDHRLVADRLVVDRLVVGRLVADRLVVDRLVADRLVVGREDDADAG